MDNNIINSVLNKSSKDIYNIALTITDEVDIINLSRIIIDFSDPYYIYLFAKNIKNAPIELLLAKLNIIKLNTINKYSNILKSTNLKDEEVREYINLIIDTIDEYIDDLNNTYHYDSF